MKTGQSVGIIGGGVVGGAVKHFFKEAKVYDKYKDSDSIEDVARARFIFICVPTPFKSTDSHGLSPQMTTDEISGNPSQNQRESVVKNQWKSVFTEGSLDISIVDEVVADLSKILPDPANQLVVIKSTALPGTTQKYQDKYPELNFAFNPEFLRDKTANEDFVKNDRQIVGYTDKTKDSQLIKELLSVLPPAPYQKIVSSEVAEMIKYAGNTFLALKVIFANQIYDACQAYGLDYDEVKKGVISDKRIGKSHWEILHTESSLGEKTEDVYRGYGGKCFPKDINSLIAMSKDLKVDLGLFEAGREVNLDLNAGKYDD